MPPAGPTRGSVLLVRTLGLGLTVLLVLAGGTSVAAEFFRQRADLSTTVAGNVTEVVVATDVGDVSVHPAGAGQPMVVRRVLSWTLQQPVVSVAHTGDRVAVDGRCRPGGVSIGGCTVDLDLTVPAGATVNVRTSAGDVRVDGIGGEITAVSSAGDVTLNGLRSPRVTATTSAGDIRIGLLTDPQTVTARSSAGDLRVSVPPDGTAYRVTGRSSAGDRRIEVPTSMAADRRIDVSTSVGTIVVTNTP